MYLMCFKCVKVFKVLKKHTTGGKLMIKIHFFSASRSKKLLLSGASEAFFAGGMNRNVSLCGSLMRKMFHSTMVETTPICKSN